MPKQGMRTAACSHRCQTCLPGSLMDDRHSVRVGRLPTGASSGSDVGALAGVGAAADARCGRDCCRWPSFCAAAALPAVVCASRWPQAVSSARPPACWAGDERQRHQWAAARGSDSTAGASRNVLFSSMQQLPCPASSGRAEPRRDHPLSRTHTPAAAQRTCADCTVCNRAMGRETAMQDSFARRGTGRRLCGQCLVCWLEEAPIRSPAQQRERDRSETAQPSRLAEQLQADHVTALLAWGAPAALAATPAAAPGLPPLLPSSRMAGEPL